MKKQLIHIGVFISSMAAILAAYYFANLQIDRQVNIVDDITIVKQIEAVTNEDGVVHIKGWAFKLEKDTADSSVEVFLRDIETGKTYWSKTERITRKDVNDYFLCEYDYSDCGFEANIKAKKLGIKSGADIQQENHVQEICLRLYYKNSAGNSIKREVSTGRYLVNGEYCPYNPSEFDEPEMTGTFLDKVFTEGTFIFYRRAEGIYLYQYEGYLYWVAQPWFYFEEDGSTYVQFQLATSQKDKLPQHRLENNWFWDNIGFYFENNEVTTDQMLPYRVTKSRIPTEYAIPYAWTGYHFNGSWVWRQYFNLNINEFFQGQ